MEPVLIEISQCNVYKLDGFGNLKLANWNVRLSSVAEIWMLRRTTSV